MGRWLTAATVNCECTREVISMLKKVITWAIVIFIIYYLATDPAGAAAFMHHIFNGLKTIGASLATFFNSL